MLGLFHCSAWTSVFLTFCIRHILCSFSSEELKLINYEVDILATPVKFGEEQSLPVLHMTSKFGQQYQCLLPQLEEKEEYPDKDSSSDESTDIKDLLKPLENGPCLLKTKDWWTYELCFGRYIKQYHIDDGKINLGQVITLGLYDSDFDWNNETVKEKFGNAKQKYHSQTYSNGTKCDLTGLPRNAEVRLFCEKDSGDYIYRVDEPGTCSYVLTVHTSRVCSHPMLKPPPSNKAHSISCSPLLNEEQYAKYLIKKNEEKLLAEQKRNQWLLDQQNHLKMMKDLDWAWDKESTQHPDGEKNDQGVEVVGTDKIDEQKSSDSMSGGEDVKKSSGTIVVHEYEVDEKSEDHIIDDYVEAKVKKLHLEDHYKELEKLTTATVSSKSFASVKETLQDEVEALLSEAEEDLDQDLNEETKDAAFSKLAATLNMLLEKLDKAEKEVAKATKELEKAKSKINSKKLEDKVQPLGASEDDVLEEEDDEDDDDEIISDDDLSLTEKSKSLVGKLKMVEDDKSQSSVLDDDKVHVRIRRLDRKSADASGKLHEMDFAQRRKLEQAVKEKLEKAGLDTGGRRIEVKIITAGYYDSEDGKDFHALSEEETSQFQNMIMALLTGQQEAVQEMERHKKLEENYKKVWNYDESKSQEEEE